MDGVSQPIQNSININTQQALPSLVTQASINNKQFDLHQQARNRPHIVAVDADSLPHGWERVIDENHGIYYIDHNNQRTQYERPYEIELTKSQCGFGFTLVEAEKGILTVRSIIHGGPAHLDGTIQPGDVLVSVVGVCVSGRQHTEVARLFAKFAVGDRVKLTFARGNTRYTDPSFLPQDYLVGEGINYNNSNLLPTSASLQDYSLANGFSHQSAVSDNNNYDLVSVTLKKGNKGFGFTISDASSGQKVKIILDNNRCLNLRQGDILMSLNGIDISNLAHKEVVEALKDCKIDEEATLVVKRKRRFRSKTPMDLHSNGALSFYQEKMLPQRNCKTPSLEVMMMHRDNDNEWAGDLDANPRIQWTSLANINGFDLYRGANSSNLLKNNVSSPSHITTNGVSNGNNPTIPISTNYNHPLHPATETYKLSPPERQLSVSDYNQEELAPENLYQNSLELQRLAIESSMTSDIYENGSHLLHHQTLQPTISQAAIDRIYLPAPQHPDSNGHQAWSSSNISPTHLIHFNAFPNQQLPHMNSYMTNTDQIKDNTSYNISKDANLSALSSNCIYHDPLYSNTVMMGYHPSHLNDDLQVLSNRSTTSASVATITNQNLYPVPPPMVDPRSQYLLTNDDNNNVNNEQLTTIPHIFMPITIQKDEMIDHGTDFALTKIDSPAIEYEYHNVVLDRGESGFGFRIMGGAEADRIISIGSIVIGGVAHKNGKLKAGDEIISINNHDVVGATHEHVVGLMSACTTNVSLLVRRKKHSEAYDVVLSRSLDEGFGFVIISCGSWALIGKIISESPADRCQRLHVRDRIIAVNGRDITAMTHPEIVNMIKESGATLQLRIIPANCYSVELIRSVKGFGFSIRGGAEFNGMPLYILRVANDGPARDSLNVGDEIIEINNISTIGMTHRQAVNIISNSDPQVKMKLRRNYVIPSGLPVDAQNTE